MDSVKAVEAVIVRANRVLILKRKNGTWQFVTGAVKDGESSEQALLREIEEETTIKDVRIVQRIGDRRIAVNGKRISIETFLVMASTVAVDLRRNPDNEHTDYKWVWLANAAKELPYEDQKDVIEKAIVALGDVYGKE